MVVVVLVCLPVTVFLTSVVPPTETYSFAVVLSLTGLTFVSQWFAVSCDPGILRPAPAGAPLPSPAPEVADGRVVADAPKVCQSCYIVRPAKSSHCPTCNNCVAEYDHHCGVVGSCVAKRTIRWFTYFFLFSTPLAGYIFIRSVVYLVQTDLGENSKTDVGRWHTAAAVGCCIYTAVTGCLVLSNAVFYLRLACQGSTMKQDARRGDYGSGGDEPHYSCKNLLCRLCGPCEPSGVRRNDD